MRNKYWLLQNLIWEVGRGNRIEIGLDDIKGVEGIHILSIHILEHLHKKMIYFMNYISCD